MTRSAIDRLRIFVSMGIPEVWRYDYGAHRIRIHVLQSDGTYGERDARRLLAEVREWVRNGCPPLAGG